MSALERVEIAALPIDLFRDVLDPGQYADLVVLAAHARELLEVRVVWCVNSTAHGGGVAEMLRSLLAYTRGAGVDTRWVVVKGRPLFFDGRGARAAGPPAVEGPARRDVGGGSS